MMLLRRAKLEDLTEIYNLANNAGIGITTLPKNKELLAERLTWSEQSFNKNISSPFDEYYLFVLEEPSTKKIVGTSAIEANVGHHLPFYSYKINKRTRICHALTIRSDYEILSLVNDYQGYSEICTLFLQPDFRHSNNGLLLSRSRFLFIANNSKRFATNILAEMRGIADEQGNSPFWNNLGQHFFQMDFANADYLTVATNKQFIADLMPRHPVYISLLSPEAQRVIGQPHCSTIPAMKILMNEGFRYNNYVDIFDAGPAIEAPCTEIRTIKTSKILTIKNLSDEVVSKPFLIANTTLNFKAIISSIVINNSSCVISKEAAELLDLKYGDTIRVSPLLTN